MSTKTLELAQKCGAVRIRRGRRGAGERSKRQQVFSILIVIDFESTCWQRNDPESSPSEVIEFPAVILDSATGAVLDEFHQYVMPTERPQLSAFCRQLTGIEQAQVDDGVPIRTCLILFARWMEAMRRKHRFVINDVADAAGGGGRKSAAFVTWSDWDLGVCLANECRRKQLSVPAFFAAWVDLRAVYHQFYRRRPNGLAGALQDVGIVFDGREHSGLCDARNTAQLCAKMVADGCVVVITANRASLPVGLRKAMPAEIVSSCSTLAVRSSLSGRSPHPKTPMQFSMLHTTKSSLSSSTFKKTPPLCRCGRRAKLCTVQAPGPNLGRGFFACPKSRKTGQSCKFFSWEVATLSTSLGQSPALKERSSNIPDVSTLSPPHNASSASWLETPSKKQYFGNVRMFNTCNRK